MTIYAVAGKKRVGKSTLTQGFINHFEKLGLRAKNYAFADELKKELDPLFLLNAGVSAFTEDPVEKELCRGVMIAYGTGYWRQKDPDHWIKKLAAQLKKDEGEVDVAIISDARFAQNEIPWVKSLGGKIIYLIRTDDEGKEFPPAGIDEEINDPELRKAADFIFSWGNYENNLEKCYYTASNWLSEILAHG